MTDYQDDTEISLGAGKLLLLFFGLVILCGAFFGVGYMIGKNSVTAQQAVADASLNSTAPDGTKPSSGVSSSVPQQKSQNDQPSTDAPFYDSVGDKNVTPKLEPAAATPAVPQQKTASPSPEPAKPAPAAAPGGSYIVQVAAVSKQQDADTLVNALRKKQYPVFVTSNPPDRLFHVQAGPFSDIRQAEAIKTRLTNDGYSPILKR